MTFKDAPQPEFDVAIVGYGPVGQALAALLGRAGHRVAVFERFRRSTASRGRFTSITRSCGCCSRSGSSEVLAEEMVPVDEYRWFGADGELLLRFEPRSPAPSGWEADYMFFQPELEAAIDSHACVPAGVTVARGWAAEGLVQSDDAGRAHAPAGERGGAGQLALTGETRTVRARWVVGRRRRQLVRARGERDLPPRPRLSGAVAGGRRRAARHGGARAPADRQPAVRPARARRRSCRAARGTGAGSSCCCPDEQASDFEDPERVWALLEPWYRPQDGPLTRSAVYEFRSMLADQMRKGRVLLVGDAAHLTPPFLGQGLCSGLRDAANLAWKLDLVLRGLAPSAAAGHDRVRAPAAERGDHPPGDRAREGAVPAGPAGGRRARRDAAPGRGRRHRSSSPPLSGGLLHRPVGDGSDPLAGHPERPGPGAPSRPRGAVRRRRRPRLSAHRRGRRPARRSCRASSARCSTRST